MQIKTRLMIPLMLIGAVMTISPVASAMDCPSNMLPTIQGLRDCVQHAVDIGHISDSGIVTSLFAKIDAAQAAQDRGQSATAADILQAFIQEVNALAGVFIEAEHADHIVMHAQMVVTDLTD